jgi:primosomal protein N' (replication factor Y)
VNSGFTTDPGIARVALDVPIAPWFDYRVGAALAGQLAIGDWVQVPWGRGRRVGLVLELCADSELAPERLKEVIARFDDAPVLPANWYALLRFAAGYYHRSIGEFALLAVPRSFRTPPAPKSRSTPFARARRPGRPALAAPRPENRSEPNTRTGSTAAAEGDPVVLPAQAPAPAPAAHRAISRSAADQPLGADQQRALDALQAVHGFSVLVLHGVTGSGKTEVYLRWFESILAARPQAQLLLMVPEIALTPQLAGLVAGRFPPESVAVLHSGLGEAERARAWLAAVEGRVRVVIGTRLAVLTPLPGLAAIVVDEEHDASYRQQDGLHYSARDLAVAAGRESGIPVLLGSATPSLETWRAIRRGRYRLLEMPSRIGGGALPQLSLLDIRGLRGESALAPQALVAIGEALARGEQALVFINRRGYAPVLGCDACGWLSGCPECSAWRVLHRVSAGAGGSRAARYQLVCHHCGGGSPVPRACPQCGNLALAGLGRGTQRLEEELAAQFPGRRIARLDRDVASRRGAAQALIAAVHDGEVDLLVGTQMLAKGHDFRRLSLVLVVDGDAGLFCADFRAPERLFATLMQVAGRAGREVAASQVLVQTRYPTHPLFDHLKRHDYSGFADALLIERRDASMPPFAHQALLRADATALDDALAFLTQARELAEPWRGADPETPVQLFDPVPMPLARLKGRERAQLLVEASARPPLHAFLPRWLDALRAIKTRARWQLEVDPAEI